MLSTLTQLLQTQRKANKIAQEGNELKRIEILVNLALGGRGGWLGLEEQARAALSTHDAGVLELSPEIAELLQAPSIVRTFPQVPTS